MLSDWSETRTFTTAADVTWSEWSAVRSFTTDTDTVWSDWSEARSFTTAALGTPYRLRHCLGAQIDSMVKRTVDTGGQVDTQQQARADLTAGTMRNVAAVADIETGIATSGSYRVSLDVAAQIDSMVHGSAETGGQINTHQHARADLATATERQLHALVDISTQVATLGTYRLTADIAAGIDTQRRNAAGLTAEAWTAISARTDIAAETATHARSLADLFVILADISDRREVMRAICAIRLHLNAITKITTTLRATTPIDLEDRYDKG